ncbi:MAG: rod shape-determining protein MreD [Chlorobi bacterium]|nr:rod shape-determining protein MreD [Chlorobiota bacterium]
MNSFNLGSHVKYIAVLVLLVMAQQFVVPFITIKEAGPQFPVLLVAFIALGYGQIQSTVYGFVAGLLGDVLAMETIGIGALALTLAGFAAGYFFDQERTDEPLGSSRYVVTVIVTAMMYYLLYIFTYFRSLNENVAELILRIGLGGAVYTAVIGIVVALIASRTGSRIKV